MYFGWAGILNIDVALLLILLSSLNLLYLPLFYKVCMVRLFYSVVFILLRQIAVLKHCCIIV
jgi:hypothetical protein